MGQIVASTAKQGDSICDMGFGFFKLRVEMVVPVYGRTAPNTAKTTTSPHIPLYWVRDAPTESVLVGLTHVLPISVYSPNRRDLNASHYAHPGDESQVSRQAISPAAQASTGAGRYTRSTRHEARLRSTASSVSRTSSGLFT